MKILLVSATQFEIRPFTDRLVPVEKHSEQFTTYRKQELIIDVLITGVGMVPTAYHLGSRLSLCSYDLAINAGVAGTFDPLTPLGTVVNVTKDSIPEFGAEDDDKFLSVFDLGFYDPDSLPFKGGKMVNESTIPNEIIRMEILRKIKKAAGITSNIIRGSASGIEKIRLLAPADVESMEGAAFFYACLCAGVPFLQIRSVSNRVAERNKSQWDLKLALKNLNETLWLLLH